MRYGTEDHLAHVVYRSTCKEMTSCTELTKWLLRLLVVATVMILYYSVNYRSRILEQSSRLKPSGVALVKSNMKLMESELIESVKFELDETSIISNPEKVKSRAIKHSYYTSVNFTGRSTASLKTTHIVRNEESLHKHFMLSLVYAEQFTNAFSHYNEFLVLASRLNYTGVEPFVKDSRLFGIRKFVTDPHTYIDLKFLIDVDSLNSQLSACFERNTLDIIRPMGDFLKHSYRKVIVVYFPWHATVLPRHVHSSMDSSLGKIFSKNSDQPILRCNNVASKAKLTRYVEDVLNKQQYMYFEANTNLGLDNGNFTVEDVFCVNRVPLSLAQLTDHLESYLNTVLSQVSIVFVSWQGKFTREFTDWRTFDFHCIKPPVTKVQLGKKVRYFADKFLWSLGFFKEHFISVHIRFEKLFQFAFKERRDSQEQFYACCMHRLELLLESLSKKYNISLNNTLLLKDYGEFGTDSCRYQGRSSPHYLCEQQTSKSLALLNVSASEFNPKRFKGTPNNSGFASLVDEVSLTNGRVLVAVGGGGYQSGLVGRYINRHKNSTYTADELHYQLCTNEKLNGLELHYHTC